MKEIRVPASTSNLGAGFDTVGLALRLFLTVRVSESDAASPQVTIRSSGEGAEDLPCDSENLIYRAMQFAARREAVDLPPVLLEVQNEIPLARGLGSSASAIVAGLSAFEVVASRTLPAEKLLLYGSAIEGHADNIAPALMGGYVTTCLAGDGAVLAARLDWPEELRAVFVVPDFHLVTAAARAILPQVLSRQDAIFNIQRAALFSAAIATRRFDLLREAMRDRLHQPARQRLVPGLDSILDLPDRPGLRGVSLSGAGPTIVAFADSHEEAIGRDISEIFAAHGITSQVRVLEICKEGRTVQ